VLWNSLCKPSGKPARQLGGEQNIGELRAAIGRPALGPALAGEIGEIERGVWLASGFGGHGLNTSAMGGELVARGLVEGDQTWRMFAPYELVWAGGRIASALAQGIYWGTRPIERVEHGLARYRERARQRKEVRKQQRLAARQGPPKEPGQEAAE